MQRFKSGVAGQQGTASTVGDDEHDGFDDESSNDGEQVLAAESEGSFAYTPTSMHWLTLSFDDHDLESLFRIEQSRATLNVGLLGNTVNMAVLIAVGVDLAYGVRRGRPDHVMEDGSPWRRLFQPIMMAMVGMLSSLPTGLLGKPKLEHQLLYWIGVPNVMIGNSLWAWFAYDDMGHLYDINDVYWYFVGLGLTIVMVSQHLLVFPFWARCCVTGSFAAASGTVMYPHARFWMLFGSLLIGEALGYVLHRAARQQYLARLLERARLSQMKAALRVAQASTPSKKSAGSIRSRSVKSHHSLASSAACELGGADPSPSATLPVADQLRNGMLPLFALLPQYYQEDGENTQYLSVDARAQLQPRVDRLGRLIGVDGTAMARGTELVGIFVMTRLSEILITFDASTTYHLEVTRAKKQGQTLRYHHSSMVAGAAVAAAGQIKVCDGRILAISNESGHYMPPPSCLAAVLARFKEMGVASLDAMRIDAVQTPLTQVAPQRHLARQSSTDEENDSPPLSKPRPRMSPTARRRMACESAE